MDVASKSRTTVCIAHRLSTIKNADNIIVVSRGEIVEQGTHDTLIALGGVYKGLVEAQRISTERTGAIEKEIAAGNAEEEAIDELVRVTSVQSSTDEVPLTRAKTLRSVTSDEAVNAFISAGIVSETQYGNFVLFRKVCLEVVRLTIDYQMEQRGIPVVNCRLVHNTFHWRSVRRSKFTLRLSYYCFPQSRFSCYEISRQLLITLVVDYCDYIILCKCGPKLGFWIRISENGMPLITAGNGRFGKFAFNLSDRLCGRRLLTLIAQITQRGP